MGTPQIDTASADAATIITPGTPPAVQPSANAPAKKVINVGERGLVLATIDDMWRFSAILADTDMVPKSYKGKAGNCFIAIQLGMELGITTMQAVQNIAPINGKPSLYGEIGLALVEASGKLKNRHGFYEGKRYDDEYKYVAMVQRVGRKPYMTEFSVGQAKTAGLWGKEGPWTNYPDAMLMWRAIWPGLINQFPEVLKGVGCAEIQQDVIDVTATRHPTPEPEVLPPAADGLGERITAVRDRLHGKPDAPAAGAVIDGEVVSDQPAAAAPAPPAADVIDADVADAGPATDRAQQFVIIDQLIGEIEEIVPGAGNVAKLGVGYTGPTPDLTGEEIADMQQKLTSMRDAFAAGKKPKADAAQAETAKSPAADAPAAPAEDPEAKAAAIGRVNALVDQIDQVRDEAGGSALYALLDTMDLDSVPLPKLLEAETHLMQVLADEQKAKAVAETAAQQAKPTATKGAGGRGQRSML